MNDLISRQAVIDAVESVDWYHQNKNGEMVHGANDDVHQAWYKAEDIYKAIKSVPSAQPGCEDAVPRASVEYICRKNTVSTNPYEHKYHDKFIQFMDDPEISDFGRWQHSNGFNTALVAVKCDLDKVPSVTPKAEQPGWIPCSKKLPELNRSVLVQLSDDFVDPIQIMTLNISKCEGDFFYFWETQEMGINFEMGDVVAWMPLPKPWEGKEQ